ncbi:hypothetical protein BDN67DRAFT_1004053 [Paxillus ammoniavirescens]|nr:hypothetical protein BDN67DRAFT_1004053 [Paxillus ammoniavirescens]
MDRLQNIFVTCRVFSPGPIRRNHIDLTLGDENSSYLSKRHTAETRFSPRHGQLRRKRSERLRERDSSLQTTGTPPEDVLLYASTSIAIGYLQDKLSIVAIVCVEELNRTGMFPSPGLDANIYSALWKWFVKPSGKREGRWKHQKVAEERLARGSGNTTTITLVRIANQRTSEDTVLGGCIMRRRHSHPLGLPLRATRRTGVFLVKAKIAKSPVISRQHPLLMPWLLFRRNRSLGVFRSVGMIGH